jgi:hypothetical protein
MLRRLEVSVLLCQAKFLSFRAFRNVNPPVRAVSSGMASDDERGGRGPNGVGAAHPIGGNDRRPLVAASRGSRPRRPGVQEGSGAAHPLRKTDGPWRALRIRP